MKLQVRYPEGSTVTKELGSEVRISSDSVAFFLGLADVARPKDKVRCHVSHSNQYGVARSFSLRDESDKLRCVGAIAWLEEDGDALVKIYLAKFAEEKIAETVASAGTMIYDLLRAENQA